MGRLKSIFKTSFGKYVNPQAIESKFTESPFFENIIVLGENKKFAAALIAPDFVYLKNWSKLHNISYSTHEEMIKHPEIVKRIQTEIKKYNAFFGSYEQIKKYQLVTDEWTMNNGFLSPTMKVKRKVLENFYSKKIEQLFE
jgi:long-chain acyl-CoA synthetase